MALLRSLIFIQLQAPVWSFTRVSVGFILVAHSQTHGFYCRGTPGNFGPYDPKFVYNL